MSKNIVFCFSGTGNSLHVAKQIAEKIPESVVVPMTGKTYEFGNDVESIGFIYPVYFSGMPIQVGNYIKKLKISQKMYVYAIATYGGMLGNGFKDLDLLLKKKNQHGLDYAEGLLMFANYVAMYPMKNAEEIKVKTDKADDKLPQIINDIRNHKKINIKKSNVLIKKYYDLLSEKCLSRDKDFNVSEKCISCKLCEKICPVQNIDIVNGKPTFKGKCEQCMACIQTCPVEAINYKNKTQDRGRYFHPAVKVPELVKFNHQND